MFGVIYQSRTLGQVVRVKVQKNSGISLDVWPNSEITSNS